MKPQNIDVLKSGISTLAGRENFFSNHFPIVDLFFNNLHQTFGLSHNWKLGRVHTAQPELSLISREFNYEIKNCLLRTENKQFCQERDSSMKQRGYKSTPVENLTLENACCWEIKKKTEIVFNCLDTNRFLEQNRIKTFSYLYFVANSKQV